MDGKEMQQKVEALIVEHKTREDGGSHIKKVDNLLRGIAAAMDADEEFMSGVWDDAHLNGRMACEAHRHQSICATLRDRASKP